MKNLYWIIQSFEYSHVVSINICIDTWVSTKRASTVVNGNKWEWELLKIHVLYRLKRNARGKKCPCAQSYQQTRENEFSLNFFRLQSKLFTTTWDKILPLLLHVFFFISFLHPHFLLHRDFICFYGDLMVMVMVSGTGTDAHERRRVSITRVPRTAAAAAAGEMQPKTK